MLHLQVQIAYLRILIGAASAHIMSGASSETAAVLLPMSTSSPFRGERRCRNC